jgi:phage host-nuclease inhibitor protein Gam
MNKPRTPRTLDQATEQLGLYAEIAGRLAAIEATRKLELGRINAAADAEAGPLIAELDALQASLQPWWLSAGQELAPKGRKSMELGGCMIGSRASRATLSIAGEEQDVVAVLGGLRWAKPLLRVKTSLDRSAIMRSLDGKHAIALAELGIEKKDGEEQFFVEPVAQAGTIGR